MAAQVTLRLLLGELLDASASGRVDEAPEAWANLEKLVRSVQRLLPDHTLPSMGCMPWEQCCCVMTGSLVWLARQGQLHN